jgi:hypothetical protein
MRATTGRPRLACQRVGRRLGGIEIAMPRRRSATRNPALSYPRSADELCWTLFGASACAANPNGLQGRFRSPHLCLLGACEMQPQRQTTSVNHQHPFRTRACAREPDTAPPFLAGAHEPSKKALDQSSRPARSRCASAARQVRSQTPASPQRLRRRHTAGGAPHSQGKSCQRQPVMRM